MIEIEPEIHRVIQNFDSDCIILEYSRAEMSSCDN